MTIQTLIKTLSDAHFDVYSGVAPDGTACPYLVLDDIEQPNFAADNRTYTETTSLRLVLVESEVHDYGLIQDLKNVLDAIPLPYSVEYNDDTSEHVCETYFYLRFLGGNTNG